MILDKIFLVSFFFSIDEARRSHVGGGGGEITKK